MNIGVLSGKGGAGKTFVSVNLAAVADKATYLDCDVEEPNGNIFLKPQKVTSEEVCVLVPEFDTERCTGCRACSDFCRFNGLMVIGNKPLLFTEVCHSCGGCAIVCPEDAITEVNRPIGAVEDGSVNNIRVLTGILNYGEASGVPIIEDLVSKAESKPDSTVIFDCPPGSACSVLETVNHVDTCILVAEPTAFGLHNIKMVYELVDLLGKPCGVVINKEVEPYEPLDDFCAEHDIPILARIPYDPKTASLVSEGQIASEHNDDMKTLFSALLKQVQGGLR